MTWILMLLIACAFTGCSTPTRTESVSFLGILESQTSDQGPVGLINGQPYQVRTVTAVSEVPYEEYACAKREGRVFTEETHGDYVYYAVKEQRDIQFDNASALVDVIERFKSRNP